MNARFVLFIILFIGFCYDLFRLWITEKHRQKPLPLEVSDIYEPERYQTYLAYTKDHRKLLIIKKLFSLMINVLMIFTPFFGVLETMANHNIYTLFGITFTINMMISLIENYVFGYLNTFTIEEKYGLNKKTKKEFNRSYLLDEIPNIILSAILYLIIIYVCEHMEQWTNHYQVDLSQALMIAGIITLIIVVFVLVASVISLIVLKKQYTFTPLEEGALKNKINALQATSKKKVKVINVYDESKKSTQKNAFLLRFLWIREFGIADNFIQENSENELLAVLSHEIGHLKHKKNIWNFISYSFFVMMFCLVVYAISHAHVILQITNWINLSFGLTINNYYLLIFYYAVLFKPFDAFISVYASNVTRMEEYEADREAVRNGYGKELINTFKRLSSDELINVNPSPIIEFLEYDHPGMYQRIKAIQDYDNKLQRQKEM